MSRTNGFVLGLAVLGLAAAAEGAGWQHYTDPTLGYSIAAPHAWTLDTHYIFQALGPGHDIKGVAFQIPARLAAGTNLATDSKLSVESLPGPDCAPARFVDPAEAVHTLHADGRSYTAASSEDAGAGNRYETELFVIDGTSPCIAVRYFIHSAAFENFDPGTVKKFDHAGLIADFDRIRATLKLGK